MEECGNVKTAHDYISILSRKDSIGLIEEVIEGGRLSTGDNSQWSNLRPEYEDLGFLEKRPYPQNPRRSVYEPTDRLEDLYGILNRYREEIEAFDEVIDSFIRKPEEWTGFLASFGEGDTGSDLSPILDETYVNRYLVQGENLSLFSTRKLGSEENVIEERTEKGRRVQEFVREVGDSLAHPDTAQADEEEEPVWKR